MEVKINREIRNYTEAMFFGLSLRQFIFYLCLRSCSRYLFSAQTVCRHRNRVLDVYFGSRPLCGSRIYQVQRYDRRKIRMGVD